VELKIPLYQLGFTLVMNTIGGGLLVHLTGPAALTGACLMAMSLPSTWFQVMHEFTHMRHSRSIGRSVGWAALSFFFLAWMYVGTLIGGDAVFFGRIQGQPEVALWLILCIMPIAPFVTYYRTQNGETLLHSVPYEAPRKVSAKITLPTFALLIFVFSLPWLILRPTRENNEQPKTPDGNFRIATVNILRGYQSNGLINFDNLWDRIDERKWDFLAIQESDACQMAYGNRDIVGYIGYYNSMYEFYGMNPKDQSFGVSYLSFHPMAENDVTVLVSPRANECEGCPLPNRILIKTVIELPVYDSTGATDVCATDLPLVPGLTRKLTIFSTQIESYAERFAVKQVRQIADIISKETGPIILTGDFRYLPDSAVMTPLYNLVDANQLFHSTLDESDLVNRNATFPETDRSTGKFVDYIFYNNIHLCFDDEVANPGILSHITDISNHVPVEANFRFLQ